MYIYIYIYIYIYNIYIYIYIYIPSNQSNIYERDWFKFDRENFILDYFFVD